MRTSSHFAAFLAAALVAVTALAQQPPDQALPPLPVASPANAQQTPPSTASASMDPQAMKEMARTVTRMAEMCETMMKKEKEALPYLGAASITLGTLIFAVLVLLVVLQMQWIIYWGRLLKAQKRNDGIDR